MNRIVILFLLTGPFSLYSSSDKQVTLKDAHLYPISKTIQALKVDYRSLRERTKIKKKLIYITQNFINNILLSNLSKDHPNYNHYLLLKDLCTFIEEISFKGDNASNFVQNKRSSFKNLLSKEKNYQQISLGQRGKKVPYQFFCFSSERLFIEEIHTQSILNAVLLFLGPNPNIDKASLEMVLQAEKIIQKTHTLAAQHKGELTYQQKANFLSIAYKIDPNSLFALLPAKIFDEILSHINFSALFPKNKNYTTPELAITLYENIPHCALLPAAPLALLSARLPKKTKTKFPGERKEES